jgi:hypothetical protein
MNRFSLGRCYMDESLIDSTSNEDEFGCIYGLFPHRNGPVCEPDEIYDLDHLTAEFIFEKAAKHEENCTTGTAKPKISVKP